MLLITSNFSHAHPRGARRLRLREARNIARKSSTPDCVIFKGRKRSRRNPLRAAFGQAKSRQWMLRAGKSYIGQRHSTWQCGGVPLKKLEGCICTGTRQHLASFKGPSGVCTWSLLQDLISSAALGAYSTYTGSQQGHLMMEVWVQPPDSCPSSFRPSCLILSLVCLTLIVTATVTPVTQYKPCSL